MRTSGYGTHVTTFWIPFWELWHILPVSGVQYWASGPSPLRFFAFGCVAFRFAPSGLLPSGMLPSGLCLRVCCPIVSLSELGLYEPLEWYLGLESSGSWILVYTVLSTCKFYDVSLICIFPRYRFSVLVFLSRTIYSDYLVELVLPSLVFVIAFLACFGIFLSFVYCVADDMRLVMIWFIFC